MVLAGRYDGTKIGIRLPRKEAFVIREHDRVALTEDLLEDGLRRGDLGVVVYIHDQNKGYEVEFNTIEGEEIAIVSLSPNQVRALTPHDIYAAREAVK
jgi:hypothetical protein